MPLTRFGAGEFTNPLLQRSHVVGYTPDELRHNVVRRQRWDVVFGRQVGEMRALNCSQTLLSRPLQCIALGKRERVFLCFERHRH